MIPLESPGMEGSMPECQLQSEVPAAAAGAPLTAPVWGPSRHEAQCGQIGHIALRPALPKVSQAFQQNL